MIDTIKMSDAIDRLIAADRQLADRYRELEKRLSGAGRPEPTGEASARSRHVQRGCLNILKKITDNYKAELDGLVNAMMTAATEAEKIERLARHAKREVA